MGFWDFANAHPGWTFLLIVAIGWAVEGAIAAARGKQRSTTKRIEDMGEATKGVIQLADMELRAMRDVLKVLEPLPVETQHRVLSWAKERVKGPNPAAYAAPPKAPVATEELFPPADATPT